MKLLYFITRSDVMGGASIHLLSLAQEMKRRGHQVVIYAGGDGVLNTKARWLGLECYSLKYLKRRIDVFNDLLSIVEMRKVISKESPDLIHLHSSKAGFIGRLSAVGKNTP